MDSDPDSQGAVLPQYRIPESATSSQNNFWQRISYTITTTSESFLQVHSGKLVFVVTFVYASAVFSKSSPEFDIFRFHETNRGIFILIMLLLWFTIFAIRLQVHGQTDKIRGSKN
ncbi:hypothetical protein DSL72_003683 [Monilinia vaccinii-corymbosi]|uniref:Uncharacterized protein n=1 Tax=Monilinia vaccinii-corymbosi TaxID=61207 RepID=A0A8A3NXG2_9HELO|nr:hypothetical protein DSL72_003683 [Monilinia vaccinii-corymbosi]